MVSDRAVPPSLILPRPGGGDVGLRAALLVAAVGALALLLPSLGSAAPPDPGLERDLVALTNVDRTSNGLHALVEDGRLVPIARERSDDMLARSYFSHSIPPTDEKVFVVMGRQGLTWEIAGENLEWNTSAREGSVQFARQDFMNSPTHRANVLRQAFTSIGVGAIPGTGCAGTSARFCIMYTVLFLNPGAPAVAPVVVAADPTFAGVAGTATEPAGSPADAPVSLPSLEEDASFIQEIAEPTNPFEFTIETALGRSLGVPGSE